MSIRQIADELWDIVRDHQRRDVPVPIKFERRLTELLDRPLRDAADIIATTAEGHEDAFHHMHVETLLRSIVEEHGVIT